MRAKQRLTAFGVELSVPGWGREGPESALSRRRRACRGRTENHHGGTYPCESGQFGAHAGNG